MANQNLIDRLNLEREITDLQKERANINKQAKADMKDRANLLDNIVSSARNNKKLAIAQKDLQKKSTEYAKKRHTIQANKYKNIAKKPIKANYSQEKFCPICPHSAVLLNLGFFISNNLTIPLGDKS